jgi:hypothetical protein
MPKKKHPETPEEQSARFKREVERMIAAGELDPDAADAAVEKLVARSPKHRSTQ